MMMNNVVLDIFQIFKIYVVIPSVHGRLKSASMHHLVNSFTQYFLLNPLRPTAIQKLLEIIGRVRLYSSGSFATALDSEDINQTTGSGGNLSM